MPLPKGIGRKGPACESEVSCRCWSAVRLAKRTRFPDLRSVPLVYLSFGPPPASVTSSVVFCQPVILVIIGIPFRQRDVIVTSKTLLTNRVDQFRQVYCCHRSLQERTRGTRVGDGAHHWI
ncbi:hypothetical protein BDV06DRAFT_431 [Aspergillus oleicola]